MVSRLLVILYFHSSLLNIELFDVQYVTTVIEKLCYPCFKFFEGKFPFIISPLRNNDYCSWTIYFFLYILLISCLVIFRLWFHSTEKNCKFFWEIESWKLHLYVSKRLKLFKHFAFSNTFKIFMHPDGNR